MDSPHPGKFDEEETAPSSPPVKPCSTADTVPQSMRQGVTEPEDLPYDQDTFPPIGKDSSDVSSIKNPAPQQHSEERYLELTEPIKKHTTTFCQDRQLLGMQDATPQVAGEDGGSASQGHRFLSNSNVRLLENTPVNQAAVAEAEKGNNNQGVERIIDTLEDLRIDPNSPVRAGVPTVVTTTRDYIGDVDDMPLSGHAKGGDDAIQSRRAGDESERKDADEDSEMHPPRGEDAQCNVNRDEQEHKAGGSAVSHGTYPRGFIPSNSSEIEDYIERTIEAGDSTSIGGENLSEPHPPNREGPFSDIYEASDEADSVAVTSGTDGGLESPVKEPAGSPVDIVPLVRDIHDEYDSDDESTEAEIFRIVFAPGRDFEVYPLTMPFSFRMAARDVWDAWKLRWSGLSAQLYKFKSHVAVEISYQRCQDIGVGTFPNPEGTRNIFRNRTDEALNGLRYLCRTLFLMERLIPEEYKRHRFLMGKLTRQLERRIEETAGVVRAFREAARLKTHETAANAERMAEIWAQDIEDRKCMMAEVGIYITPFNDENHNDDWFGELITRPVQPAGVASEENAEVGIVG